MAVQEGPTSIRVSWSPPTLLGDTTGYRIYYSDSDSSDSVDVSGGSTDNYTLTGLQNGDSYTISIVATSQHLPSESVTLDMDVGLCKSSNFNSVLKYFCLRWPAYSIIICMTSTIIVDVIHCSSEPTNCQHGYHNSHHHLPLLD